MRIRPGLLFAELLLLAAAMPPLAFSQAADLRVSDPVKAPATIHSFNNSLLMATAFQGIRFSGPEMSDAVTQLRPQGLRFPGGTTANNYLWEEDTYAEQPDDLTKWAAEQLRLFRKMGRPYDLKGYAQLCRRHGVAPIWVLNVYHETPASIERWVKRIDELGLDVKAVEFGNEPYWDPRSLNNVSKYSQYCRPLAEMLKALRPEIEIGACFAPLNREFDYEGKWNAVLAKEDWYDAAVFHEYYGGQGIAVDAGSDVSTQALLYPESLVDEPIEALGEYVPGKPIWFTEWNVGLKELEQCKDYGSELLFIAAIHVRLVEEHEKVPWSCYHQMYGERFGAFAYDAESGRQRKSASYALFEMLGRAWRGAEQLQMVTLPESDHVRGFVTASPKGKRLFLFNRGDKSRSIKLPAHFPPEASVQTLRCPPSEQIDGADFAPETTAARSGVMTLAPYSISLIGETPSTPAGSSSPRRAPNLFPPRPHLTLWHPPYARQQPRFDTEGVYEVDLEKIGDQQTAVVTMDLSSLALSEGDEYELRFEVLSTSPGGVTFIYPSPASAGSDKPRTEYVTLTTSFKRHWTRFRYAPAIAKGQVTAAFSSEIISRDAQVRFKNFVIRHVAD